MTYLAGYYHKFAKMEHEDLYIKRVQAVMAFEMEIEEEEVCDRPRAQPE